MTQPRRPTDRARSLDALLIVADACAKGRAAPASAAEWFAASIDRFITSSLSLDAAMGLRPGPGERHPTTLRRTTERDRALGIAAMHFAEPSRRAVARRLAEALRRYEATGWRRDRLCEVCPHDPSSPAAALWHVLKMNRGEPLAAERIRKIWGESSGYS
jgi:hypothetical protein